jgi:hypothetical protein
LQPGFWVIQRPTGMMLALLAIVWVCVRRTAVALAKRGEQELRFEEEPPPAVIELGLHWN